ncbi:MAG: Glu/Leu/Phe/Val dehydrogenase dimerization domain-containing protein [Bacteroidia bacterium]|nr:Glu/Leu/Phe/Val dehydrogenase dimerization domain-containing protein [Bacteroidia bacterium]
MYQNLKQFETQAPETVVHWQDRETDAEGWLVINSLRNGAAGGGTRMHKGCTLQEVISLAKTMEVKFTVCGPPIGGAKSGIRFDPADPRKQGVLERWFKAIYPLLKHYYGTGGDLNVDEVSEVMALSYDLGIHHPQEGIVNGFLAAGMGQRNLVLRQLREGVARQVTHWDYAPTTTERKITVSDMVTGYGVGMSVVHYYQLWQKSAVGKKVIVQGFGNVGGAAALTLAKEGFQVVGILDRRGGILAPEGLSLDQIKTLYLSREGNQLALEGLMPFDTLDQVIWDTGADIFIPAAGSRLVTREQVSRLISSGLELIASGANVPFADPDIFLGPTGIYADNQLSVIPDFIANCGMARTFAYLMQPGISLDDEAIFTDISRTIHDALAALLPTCPAGTGLWQAALDRSLTILGQKTL